MERFSGHSYAPFVFGVYVEGAMEDHRQLRRQAEFCLRLSERCNDDLFANHMRFMAADYHQRALMAEFGAECECQSARGAHRFENAVVCN
jgi:hypothetical protein